MPDVIHLRLEEGPLLNLERHVGLLQKGQTFLQMVVVCFGKGTEDYFVFEMKQADFPTDPIQDNIHIMVDDLPKTGHAININDGG